MKVWILSLLLSLTIAQLAGQPPVARQAHITVSAAGRQQLQRRFGSVLPLIERLRQWTDPNIRARRGRGLVLTQAQKSWYDSLTPGPTGRQSRHHGIGSIFRYRIRREYRELSCRERAEFHQALRRMKTTMHDGMSEYDIFVGYHDPVQSPHAHEGAAFLPWHRVFLFRFENALRRHNSRVSLPYWDSTLDGQLPSPQDSIIWSDQFLGDNSGTVESGPFTDWTTITNCQGIGSRLTRRVGDVSSDALFREEDIDWVLGRTTFRDLHVPLPLFEWAHGGPHVYVGGHMGNIFCSPTDPIFWMHHAFIDYIWEMFRRRSQTTDPYTEYPVHSPSNNIGGEGHNPDATMFPFGPLVNKDGIRAYFTRYFYNYSPRRRDCSNPWQCGRYMFCHQGRCKSKVKLNGDCTGLVSSSSSYYERRAPCECGTCSPVQPGSTQYTCRLARGTRCFERGCNHYYG